MQEFKTKLRWIMFVRYAGVLSLTMFVLFQTVGFAQTQKPYGPPISVENAKKIAAVALAQAKKNNWTMAVAVVDPSGTLVYYEKMDNTQTGSANIAVEKAKTAALFKRPSKVFQDAATRGGSGLIALAVPGAVPIQGGIPLVLDDKIVGAIGVSGDSSDHDALCAQAAVDALK
jgi:glc operon protein GlcG